MKRGIILSAFLLTVIVLGLSGLNQASAATEEEEQTQSNATVSDYVAIDMSTNLTGGIRFGSVDPGVNDNNATGNVMAGDSLYYITISNDSNVNIDLCIKANDTMDTATDSIELGNYTWDSNAAAADPALPGSAITQAYAAAGSDIAPGNNHYFRFWLDVPTAQPAGTYKNTVSFKAVKNGESC